MVEAQEDFIQPRETKIIKGNVAAAYAAKSARVQVISAYPITPQTTVVEKLSEFVDKGEMPGTEYIKVESEHTVMASMIGASTAGTRTFTATSGQGLLGSRCSITNCNYNSFARSRTTVEYLGRFYRHNKLQRYWMDDFICSKPSRNL